MCNLSIVNVYYLNTSIQMDNVNEINIKNREPYFFNDITNIKDLDPDNIRSKVTKNIRIHYIYHQVCDTKKPYHQQDKQINQRN